MSTVRVRALTIDEGVPAVNSTVRVRGLTISDRGAVAVTITGPTSVEAGEPITLTANVTGGTPSGYTWTQTAGPTLIPSTEAATYQALAPSAQYGTTVTMQVTVDPGGVMDSHTITVAGASFLRYFGGEWVPWPEYLLTGSGGFTPPTALAYDGGDADDLLLVIYDGGSAPVFAPELVMDGGTA